SYPSTKPWRPNLHQLLPDGGSLLSLVGGLPWHATIVNVAKHKTVQRPIAAAFCLPLWSYCAPPSGTTTLLAASLTLAVRGAGGYAPRWVTGRTEKEQDARRRRGRSLQRRPHTAGAPCRLRLCEAPQKSPTSSPNTAAANPMR